MGFSSPEAGAGGKTPDRPSFGQSMLSEVQRSYPVAGGLANLIFGGNTAGYQQMQDTPAATMAQPKQELPPQDDLISMNAQPKSGGGGGGLVTVLRLLAGGA